MRVRGDVRRYRYQPGGDRRLIRPVIDEDVGLVLGRQVDRAPAPVSPPLFLRVHGVNEMSEAEFRRAADRMISPASAPEQHDRPGLAQPAKHLQGAGSQRRSRQRVDQAAVDVEGPDQARVLAVHRG